MFSKATSINRQWTKWLMFFSLLGGLIASAVITAGVAVADTGSVFYIGVSSYSVDGTSKPMETAPYIKQSRTYLPLAYVASALGINNEGIVWDAASGSVTLSKDNTVVKLTIGSKTMLVNNSACIMDVAPEITGGRTCMPIAMIARAFGATIEWNASTQAITIIPGTSSGPTSGGSNLDEKLALFKQAQIDYQQKWGEKPELGPPYGDVKYRVNLIMCPNYDPSASENIILVGWYSTSFYTCMKYKHDGPGKWTFIAWMDSDDEYDSGWQTP